MTTVDKLTRADLARHLSESLGEEKAAEVIAEAARALGYAVDEYDKQQTLQILERLAKQPGLVGIVARFAKVRIILKFK